MCYYLLLAKEHHASNGCGVSCARLSFLQCKLTPPAARWLSKTEKVRSFLSFRQLSGTRQPELDNTHMLEKNIPRINLIWMTTAVTHTQMQSWCFLVVIVPFSPPQVLRGWCHIPYVKINLEWSLCFFLCQ